MRGDDRMMSILTGLILVVVLGAIVQKSDTLMDAFSGLTDDPTGTTGAATKAPGAPGATGGEAFESASATSVGDTPAEPGAEPGADFPADQAIPPAQQGQGASGFAMDVPSDLAGYRSAIDDVTVESGGTYSIDVLGNDIGVRPEAYERLVLLSSPKCGIVRLYEGRIAYFADELCQGVQRISYCIDGADPKQCEQGLLTIHVAPASGGTLDPARFMNDVTPGARGVYRSDRTPNVDISISAPVVDEHPSALPSVKSAAGLRAARPRDTASAGFADPSTEFTARAKAPARSGLFAGITAGDAEPPVARAGVDRPNAVALLDKETETAPLASPARAKAQGDGLFLSPLPVAKPGPIDHDAPDAPRVAGTGALQSLVVADASAPSGGAVATRVKVGGASRAELLARRSETGPPPNSRSVAASALAAPEIAGDTPAIASLSEARVAGADAPALNRTDYASVASLVAADPGGAVAVNRIARLSGAPAPATPGPERAPGGLQTVNLERGSGGAGGFTLRDRATRAGEADAAQPLTKFLRTLAGKTPAGVEVGLQAVTFEDPVPAAPKGIAGAEIDARARHDVATSGAFTLRDQPARAIPREALAVNPGVASTETPKIEPVDTTARNLDDPQNLRQNAATGAQPEPGVQVAAVSPTGPDAAQPIVEPGSRGGLAAPADCSVDLSVIGARGALIRAEAVSPCRAGQVVRFVHHGLEFAARFDAAGVAALLLPALARDGIVLARTEDAAEAYGRATAPGLAQVSRVAMIWPDELDLNLHAFEYGADLGANGHVWAGATQDLTNYKRGRTGLLQTFQPIDGYGDNIEVYSFAPGRRSVEGAVDLAIEFASRGDMPASPYCDGGALAAPRFTILRLENGKLAPPFEGAIASVRCGTPLTEDARYRRGIFPEIVVSN